MRIRGAALCPPFIQISQVALLRLFRTALARLSVFCQYVNGPDNVTKLCGLGQIAGKLNRCNTTHTEIYKSGNVDNAVTLFFFTTKYPLVCFHFLTRYHNRLYFCAATEGYMLAWPGQGRDDQTLPPCFFFFFRCHWPLQNSEVKTDARIETGSVVELV
ncbi:hypothetical protein V8C35DRAFT_256692 [Trichoderma chlorosporum]